MIRNHFRTVIIILLLTGLSSCLFGQMVTAAFIPGLDPFSYLGDNGKRTGFYIDLLNALSDELGFEVEYIDGSWAENFNAGKEGTLDLLISVTYTDERSEYLDFLSEMVVSSWTQVIRERKSDIESILDLNGKNVGVMKYDQNGEAFLRFADKFDLEMHVIEYDSFKSMCEAMERGEILAGSIQNFFDISAYPQLERTSIIFNGFSTTYATAKGRNRELMSSLDEQLSAWKSDEKSPYHVLFNKYFGISAQTVIPSWIITLLLFFILASSASWLIVRSLTRKLRNANSNLAELNRTLERKVEERSRALDESRAQLINVDKMALLGEMVSGVAHEVNTPIGVALTASGFLLDNVKQIEGRIREGSLSQEEFSDFLENVISSGQMVNTNILRAANIVSSFKEISIDQNLDESRVINLKDYSEALMVSLSPKIKHTVFSYRLHADDIVVETHPGLITQIITNLFLNSLVHGFEGRGSGIIDISLVCDAEVREIVIEVSDDGNGIPETIYKTMYEPFVSSKRFQGSSGIGLNIVHNIVVRRLGGSIECKTSPSRGTRFIITIPVVTAV